MVRITRVYTRTGDKGTTHLAGGQKIAKSALRIEAYGTVDELNAFLGWAIEGMKDCGELDPLPSRMRRIQQELFDLGAQLAVLPEDRRADTPTIHKPLIDRLEQEIDEMNTHLPALTSFVLPGGGEIATRLHIARTVCRRAERAVVRLAEAEPLDGSEIAYLNRLSDWLFVAARYVAHQLGRDEILWSSNR
ncbi:MAG: cob(I)yrinic acid a,c-diamide adenosyltransferase [Calditrichaeota bacterium]|nr:cob(I)yrinic acid a,c-diamide adenosyltransferase [Calditrichota bacterium]